MNLDKILKHIQTRQGQIRQNRAALNAEEVRLFKLRDKISEKIAQKQQNCGIIALSINEKQGA